MLPMLLLGIFIVFYAIFFPVLQMDFIELILILMISLFLFEKANEKWFFLYFFVFVFFLLPLSLGLFISAIIPAFLLFWLMQVFLLPRVKHPTFWQTFVLLSAAVFTLYPDIVLHASQGDFSGLLRPILAPLGFNW